MTTVLFLVLNNYEWAMVNNRQSIVCSAAVHISVFFYCHLLIESNSLRNGTQTEPKLNQPINQSINQSIKTVTKYEAFLYSMLPKSFNFNISVLEKHYVSQFTRHAYTTRCQVSTACLLWYLILFPNPSYF